MNDRQKTKQQLIDELMELHQRVSKLEAERNAAEESLRGTEERHRELVEISNDIVYRTDAGGVFTFVNRVVSKITGYSKEEIIGKHYLELIHPEYRAEAERFYGRQFVNKNPTTYYEFPFLTKKGETAWVGQNVQFLMEGDAVVGFQAIARDITERKLAERELDRAKRYGWQLAILLIDLDHFKKINDTFGHAVGDEALKKVAEIGMTTVRKVDIFARYGGEEFAGAMPETNIGACCPGCRAAPSAHRSNPDDR